MSVPTLPPATPFSSQLDASPTPIGLAWVAVPMALSGFASLAYQIVWTQQLGTWLGHEVAAVLAVVAAFFGGLALGASALGRVIAGSRHPGRWYVWLELTILVWALVLIALMPVAGAALSYWIGPDPSPLRHWTVALLGPLLLLLPATAAMGATLPAMERVLGQWRDTGYALGGLYALNTLGAVAGTLAAAFWLIPAIGLASTAGVAVAINAVCALWAWWVLSAVRRSPEPASSQVARQRRARAPLVRLALGGLLGIGLEVLVVRVLSQLAENTVYTYALLLAIYLLGTAGGAAIYQRWLAARHDALRLRTWLLAATAGAGLLTVGALAAAPMLLESSAAAFGPGFEAALATEAWLGLVAFGLPTVVMGALFSHLAVEARDAGWRFGDALACNMLGATLAAPLFGVLLLPWLGAGPLLVSLAGAYLLMMPGRAWYGASAWAPAGVVLAVLLVGPSLRVVQVPEGGRLLSHADGVLAAVSVIEDADGVKRLHINNREQEGSSATRLADARQAWLPLLLHPEPRSALFLGLGTGVTAASAVSPGLQVQAVELLPEVVAAAAQFVPAMATPGAAAAPRVRVADARRHVRADAERHDVIVADLFHPARSGSGALFTVEHFQAVTARLAPGGLFCQWLPVHQLDLHSLRSIVAAFLIIHPQAVAVLATNSLDTPVLGLVGHADVSGWTAEALQARWASASRAGLLAGLQLDDGWSVPGSVFADAGALRRFAGSVAPNRDDRPVVAYHAPRLRDTPGDGPRQRLRALVESLQAEPAAVFGVPRDAAEQIWQQRVAAYWAARDQYLLAGMTVQPSAGLHALLAQVREPLLATLRVSPDFRPAYDPLLRMAQALAHEDPGAAHGLLSALQQVQPARPEAGDLMRRIGSPS